MGDFELPPADRETVVRRLDIEQSDMSEHPTVTELRDTVDERSGSELGSIGAALRTDFSGEVDTEHLADALADLGRQIDRLETVRDAGVPDGDTEPERLYREVAEPGWRIYDHLADVGFFDVVGSHLPRFTEEHIEHTTRELLYADQLNAGLSDLGFDEREQTTLIMDVVNNTRRLSRWVPTREIPAGIEFDVEHVPPLSMRAMGGALLWIDGLDRHLWQNEVLVTEKILDDAYQDVKALLGGTYLLSRAPLAIARDGDMTDAELTTALTAGAAIAIISQEAIASDVFRITDEMRAPSRLR